MSIITISRELGSAGTTIAQHLVNETHYSFFDKRTVEEKLTGFGIPKEDTERYDEKKPGFWYRISANAENYFHYLKMAVYEVAREGNCVILGRGGQIILGDVPGVLNVRIVSRQKERARRIKEKLSCDDYYAEKLIQRSDQNRAGFHKVFFHSSWEDPRLYDLVLNTNKLNTMSAVRLIMEAAHLSQITKREDEARRLLDNLWLAHEVKTSIIYRAGIPLRFIDITADDGVIMLKGSAYSTEAISRCEKYARRVDGVKDVINELVYIPYPHGRL